ncbi:sensor histidine kinase [Nocardia pseudovaccinii]|uniref:sensor histidine kinase n=1 Tax=Nocardia pseudovaccinii TaxID=189540 RepID=UPI0007C6C8B0|nr:nitrate- and nitrite sensing domain-containing protein [Nocardia pseudovaccinii]
MFKRAHGLRARIMATALIPSLVLLAVGTGAAAYLVTTGRHSKSLSTEIQRQTGPGMDFLAAVQQERSLTLRKIVGGQAVPNELAECRRAVDAAVKAVTEAVRAVNDIDSTVIETQAEGLRQLVSQLTSIRSSADARTLAIQDGYTFYNALIDLTTSSMNAVTKRSSATASALQQAVASRVFRATDALVRGHALAAAVLGPGGTSELTAEQLREFVYQVGYSRTEIANLMPALRADEKAQLEQLQASLAWHQLAVVENTILERGSNSPVDPSGDQGRAIGATGRTFRSDTTASPVGPTIIPVPFDDWQSATNVVSGELLSLWRSHQQHAQQLATDSGSRVAHNSMLGGVAILLVAITALLVALRLANRMIKRLTQLRTRTLALADEQLPAVMDRLGRGELVDLDEEISTLDFGSDEIGQVAAAFNRAQLAAVSAAATEAKTREGVNTVFVKIAHRSQVVMHRQLDLLYEAECEHEDPALLAMLFQLDHLATRERRNAENLIILGGEQPGRRWTSPVPLVDLVRGAISETQDYARVRIVRLPEVRIVGDAVADTMHLLAELIDNATTFSPPECRVDVSGNVVGRGLAIEITDQGLGIPESQLEQINETLRNPPDFALIALTTDSRLGIFVVARLAARHQINIHLVESEYGGIKAILLIPSSLLTSNADHHDDAAPTHFQPMAARRGTLRQTVDISQGSSWYLPDMRDDAAPPASPSEDIPLRNDSIESGTYLGRQQSFGEGRPPLPRRRRQNSMAPQLPQPPAQTNRTTAVRIEGRSAEQARDLFSAIENGTRRGRDSWFGQGPAPLASED